MKNLFIIANWKANMTEEEANFWLGKINDLLRQNPNYGRGNKEIIVCPPFTLLVIVKKFVKLNNLPIRIGSQDISIFGKGAYTGEVPAVLLHDFVDATIIGHSERRKNFNETDDMVAKKTENAKSANFLPIVCVQGVETPVPKDAIIAAYEPVFAIGSGTPDTPENAEQVAKKIKEKSGVHYVVYGGSVTGENVNAFTSMQSIDGVLVGGASLDAEKFMQIIKNS